MTATKSKNPTKISDPERRGAKDAEKRIFSSANWSTLIWMWRPRPKDQRRIPTSGFRPVTAGHSFHPCFRGFRGVSWLTPPQPVPTGCCLHATKW